MKKLLLAAVLVAALFSAFPNLRERARPRVQPLFERGGELLGKALRPFVTPLNRKYARDDVRKIVHDLRVEVLNRGRQVPRASQFRNWVIRERLTDSEGLDPWGNAYYLLQGADTLYVVSSGEDGEPATSDDIREGFPHRR